MPIEFFQNLSSLTRRAHLSMALSFSFVFWPCVAIALWNINTTWSVLTACMFPISLGAFILLTRNSKKENISPWCVDIACSDCWLHQLSFIEVQPKSYVSQSVYKGIKLRVLVQYEDFFDQFAAANNRKSANRKANRLLDHKGKVSIFEAQHMARINIVICEEESKELVHWIQNTNQLLHRAECIINMAVIKRENKLGVPALGGDFDVGELKRYRTAVQYITSALMSVGTA